MAQSPILITGCQRSGTTLLSLILDSHQKILAIDEDAFQNEDMPTYLNAPGLPPYVSFKLPQYAPSIAFIKSFSTLKLLWCVRNPLDVVASMLRLQQPLGTEGQQLPWAQHPGCGRREILNTFFSFDARLKEKYAAATQTYERIFVKNPEEVSREESVFAAALCWAMKNDIPQLYEGNGLEYFPVNYERLVTQAPQEVAGILEYIGVDWDDNVLNHHQLHAGVSIGDTDNSRQIDQSSLGSGLRSLSGSEVELVAAVCSDVAQRWGYELTGA